VGVVTVTWPAGSDRTTVHGTRSMVAVAKAADSADARGVATRGSQRQQARVGDPTGARTAASDVDLGAVAPGAPVAVGAKADVADDPTRAGRLHTDRIAVVSPLPGIGAAGHGDRDDDAGLLCRRLSVGC
jgi:hypothetical protein